MNRTLLIGAGTFVESLREGLEAQQHAVASVEPVRTSGATTPGGDLDLPEAALKSAAEQLGSLDLIVHIPPVPDGPKKLIDQTSDNWIAACETPLHEAVAVARVSYQLLVSQSTSSGPQSSGRLVWVLPTTALGGSTGYVGTGAAFEGIRALSKGAAKQWGADGVTTTILLVNPTIFFAEGRGPETDGMRDAVIPALGRAGDPATDISPLLDLLADPRAAFTTGGTIVADGGIWMAQ